MTGLNSEWTACRSIKKILLICILCVSTNKNASGASRTHICPLGSPQGPLIPSQISEGFTPGMSIRWRQRRYIGDRDPSWPLCTVIYWRHWTTATVLDVELTVYRLPCLMLGNESTWLGKNEAKQAMKKRDQRKAPLSSGTTSVRRVTLFSEWSRVKLRRTSQTYVAGYVV